MKKLFFFSILISCFVLGCTSSSETNNSTSTDDDIVETPPAKKEKATTSTTPTPITGPQTTIGTFTEMEEGDYFYIHMKDDDGKKVSYRIIRAYQGGDQLNIDNWKTVVGKKIKVTWEETEEDIPEEGGKQMVKKVLGVEML